MYYLWSLLASVISFVAILYNEYNNTDNKRHYNPFTFTNFGTFVILYIILTIAMYMITGNAGVKTTFNTKAINGGGVNIKSASVDPNILRKISDNVYTGFSPNMNSDI
jgi:hypothetical protein